MKYIRLFLMLQVLEAAHGFSAGYAPNAKLEPRLYAPVIDVVLSALGEDASDLRGPCQVTPKIYMYHEDQSERFKLMVNSRNGIRSTALSFHHIIQEVSSPESLIQLLQQDGTDKILIIPGGYAPAFGESFGLDEMGVDAPVAVAIRTAVRHRGWTYVGDCAGANIAFPTYIGYDWKPYMGIALVEGCAMVAPNQERRKLKAVDVDFCSGAYKGTVSVVFCDGPIFCFPPGKEPKVLAKWSSNDSDLAGEAALVSLQLGKGKVILSSMNFESVYLRCPEFIKAYYEIKKNDPLLSSEEILKEMVNSFDEECSITDDASDAQQAACDACHPLNIKDNWVVLRLLIHEMSAANSYEGLKP